MFKIIIYKTPSHDLNNLSHLILINFVIRVVLVSLIVVFAAQSSVKIYWDKMDLAIIAWKMFNLVSSVIVAFKFVNLEIIVRLIKLVAYHKVNVDVLQSYAYRINVVIVVWNVVKMEDNANAAKFAGNLDVKDAQLDVGLNVLRIYVVHGGFGEY